MKIFSSLVISMAMAYHCLAVPPTVSNFTPASACSGMTVTINGNNFSGATVVGFGSTSAMSFIVVSSTQITAVIGLGTSGPVAVTTIDGTGTKTGFTYIPTSRIITDFGGYWSSTGAAPNATLPDDSHNLLAFAYDGIIYSTGVNNTILDNNTVTYTSSSYKALPVAGISGITAGGSTYIALGKKADGSAAVANASAVSSYSVKNALVDGQNGLNLGTGVTNLPTSAVLTFQIFNINVPAISDAEPDILLTQIAQPVAGNDQYCFIDASGAVVGNTLVLDMTLLPAFGFWGLDLFNLTPSTPYNSATVYSASVVNTTREIRVAGLRLSDFGITGGNVGQVKALRITPSGNSDYAFIAYNTNAINLPPNITQNITATNSSICSGGTANLAIIAVPAAGGALSYSWEESTDGGGSWSPVTDGGNYAGATTDTLSVTNALNDSKYRATVVEAGNPGSSTSSDFAIAVSTFTAPSLVNINVSSGTSTTCLNNPLQLNGVVTGGSNLYFQWQRNASGSYTDIPGANINTYLPPVGQTGNINYRVQVTSGSGCGSPITASPIIVTVTGVSSVVPNEVCNSGAMTLSAAATSGNIDWYAADAGGTSLLTGTSYTTPVLGSTATYYVSASGCAGALRVPVVATVHPNTVGGTVDGATIVVTGTNSTTLTLGGYTGSIQKWQSSTDGFSSLITDIANTSNQLTITNIAQTTAYRSVIKSGTCAAAFSSAATIFVGGTLPIFLSNVKATRENNVIKIEWKIFGEQSIAHYELEKSTDGTNFFNIQTVAVARNNNDCYNTTDPRPAKGINYYRIKEVFTTGLCAHSLTVKVLFDDYQPSIVLYPNPITDGTVTLQFHDVERGTYNIRVVNNEGQISYLSAHVNPGGHNPPAIRLSTFMHRGLYAMDITGPDNQRYSFSFVVL